MPPRSPATLTCHAHLPWHPHFKTCQHRAPSQNARIGRSTSVAEGAAASSASGFERAPARGRRRAEERAEALERTAKRGIKGKKFYIRLRIGIAVSVQAGAVKYEVQNIGSTNAALLGLLGKVTWSGKHMGVLGESQEDGKRRFILFTALLLYFEEKNDTADLALCRVVVHRFTVVATSLLIGFRLPPAPHKLGVMLTEWGATDQDWHNDSLGVKDIYSSVLPLMYR